MLKESLNNSRFSPKNSDNGLLKEYKLEIELLNKELEKEKCKAQEARKQFAFERKRCKETYEKEKSKLVDDLKSKWEQQRTCELQQLKDTVLRERELEIKHLMRWKEEELREFKLFLQKERDSAIKQARELQRQLVDELLNKRYARKSSSANKNEQTLSASECQCKLQDVLSKLRWDYDSEQAARIRHLKVELDLERNLFIKYILDSSYSNLSAILRRNEKRIDCGEIKYGRYSLGSQATKPCSLEIVRQRSLEIVGSHNRYPESILLRSRSLDCAGGEFLHNSTEKSWKLSPESILMPRQTECHETHTLETNVTFSGVKNDSTQQPGLEGELPQFPENTECSFHNVSTVIEDDCAVSLEALDCNQSRGSNAQSVDILQHWSNVSDHCSMQDAELLNALRNLEQRCKDLKEENIILRKSSFPETEEKVKRLKRKNAELAVIAKRLEERARKLQEANLKMVNTPMHLKGASLELCRKAFASQRAKDMSDQASALLAKDKQIETLKQECQELQVKLSAGTDFQSWLKLSDFNRLLHESQKEVLRLQRQIAMKYLKEPLNLTRSESPSSPTPPEVMCVDRLGHSDHRTEDSDNSVMAASVDSCQEVELRRKRKECESLEQEVKKKQKRCEELEIQIEEVQTKNACLAEENSRLCLKVKRAANVESENADLKRHLAEVTEQRDSALKESHRLQSKLENLEQVLKHMRDVAERRQQLEKDHEDAVVALQKRKEEVKRLQEAQVEAKKEHEGAVQLLENTLDSLQAKVKLLEEKCRSQTEQFSLLSGELERFRLQTGNIDLLTSTLGTSELLPPQCCSTPGISPVQQDRGDEFSSWDVISWVDISLINNSASFIYLSMEDVNESVPLTIAEEKKVEKKQLPETPEQSHGVNNVEVTDHAAAKELQKPEVPHISSKSDSTHESSKSCPTPEVDTASEMEDLEADSVSLNPEPETRPTAKLQVFLARYSYNPFDGPNENPEAELPLTAGEYIYIYGGMDDDGFYEGELMDGRRGLVPSNFVERVSDDDLIACHPGEINELSQSSGQDISFLSGSSMERSEEEDDESSLSPLPMQGNSEGAADVSAVPYPRKLTLIKQLARSLVVGWEPPLVAAGTGNILSYNIYVDNELRQNVRCGGQTKALIEKMELKTRTYRISVQSMTERGCSDRMRCTMLVGYGYTLAPTQLRVRSLSATSAEITWQPCNSNYSHALYLNEESCGLAKSGTYWYTFSSLRPSTMYNVKVEARPQRIPLELPIERREPKTTVMQLTTPAAGPPDAPLDVQVELGPKPGILLVTWLPVTIDAAGTSNGVRVNGYAVYADKQKVLEVSSPTAGSVLVGTSHLQLLQLSREISVRTMSASGESVDSVPAQIPSALLKIPDRPSLSHNFSNTNPKAAVQNLCSHSEKVPSMPLTSSSPCSVNNPPASTSQANISIHMSCSTCDSIETVRTLPHLMISPLSASSSYCRGSSSSEPSGVQVSYQGTQDGVPSSLPEPVNLPFLARTVYDSMERSEMLQARATALQDDSQKCSNTKEPVICEQAFASGLPLGSTWGKENTTELKTTAKDDCSRPETALSEDAATPSCNLSNRGISIEDFLEVDCKEDKVSSGTHFKYEAEVAGESLSDTHSSVTHIDHSRSSNLSDILEEEEDEEDDPHANPSVKKLGHPSLRAGADSKGKLDCCETDSDEEILERILDLPLQKHCSKKLFSIPEVTEEEDEEEENNSPRIISKTLLCHMETQKYQYMKAQVAFPQNTITEACVNLPTETCGKEMAANSRKAECVGENCACLDQDWHLKSKSCVSYSSPDYVKQSVSESITWNAKRDNHVNERTHSLTEPNRKRQNDGREHCSRLSPSSNQAGFYNSRFYNQKELVANSTSRETSTISRKSLKTKQSRHYQRHRLAGPTNAKAKVPSPFTTNYLEIDVEYDTEEEEELLSPARCVFRTKVDLWDDSSQTDREGWSESSTCSEPIQYTRKKKEVKRPIKVHAVETEYAKESQPRLHVGKIYGTQQGSNSFEQVSRAASNKTLMTARWAYAEKDDVNEDPLMPSVSSPTEIVASDRKARKSRLTSDSESDAEHSTQPNYCQENTLENRENISKNQEGDSVRLFVSLFDYDPETMSPNPDAYMEELPFKEGQILQVFGDKDADGFYHGKYDGRTGYIPCNMVSELHIQSEEVRMQLLRQGHLSSTSLLNDLEIRAFSPPPHPPIAHPGHIAIPPPKPRRFKKVQTASSQEENNAADKHPKKRNSDMSISRPMVAIFDYNPKESSPNMDVEAELSFTAGDVITVFGQMDEDGFYYGELNGQRGLVPSNYLELSQTQTEEANSQGTARIRGDKEFSFDVDIDQPCSPLNESISSDSAVESKETSSETTELYQGITYTKKKKSFFSKGRKLFKKLGSTGKNL
ncbi:peripheral-type benzodiazepine receptor-associated protein 1 isoform X3 [Pseudophryne corroboree]|uniref:peripheral-type benzodiazepine receptor-associated protein 1 isoform X3 n=1 Tax=Pseudophryne corroboree TaxID=495146 RepID=UPI0030820199